MLLKFVPKGFGLDISEKVWRLVQLKKVGSRFKLISYGEVQVPDGYFQDSQIVKNSEAAALFKKLVTLAKGAKIFTKHVFACLPEPKTFIKVINLTYPKSKNIIDEIIEETKKHIPYPLEKVYLDWQFLKPSQKNRVIVGACPKNIVNNYQEVLAQASLMPVALEIEALAIARALFPLNQKVKESVLVLDLGASRTGLFIYEQDYIPFSLSLNISSDDLTLQIKNKLQLTLKEAEQAKRRLGLNPKKAGGGLSQILEPPLEKLAQEIREAKYFYYEHFSPRQELAKVYLTGGGANLIKLSEFLKERVKLEVTLGQPLLNISSSKINIPVEKLQSYTTAIGLALRQYQ